MNDDRWQDAETRLNALRVKLDGVPSVLRHSEAWKAAEVWVHDSLSHVESKTAPAGADPETWWEDFERYLALHEDALDVARREHDKGLEQDKQKRQRKWAQEKHRLKAAESSFIVLKILMILSWTMALGLGSSTRVLGALALATAAPGVLETLRRRRALAPETFVVERQAMYDLRDRFRRWMWGFVGSAAVGLLFALFKALFAE